MTTLIDEAVDVEAITATALDYAEGAYTGDGARMERALHGQLAKRMVMTGADGKSRLVQMSALELMQYARDGHGLQPENNRQRDIQILDIFQNVANVRLEMNDWIDYLQLARWNGRWVIVNVLWELKAR
ncbi:MAG: nuclear transport factor 2 family protein [bacterium]|nr:nuclear transport factor 2 family protein [bacterium]